MRRSGPLVSILIPCRGCREFIGEAIRSALSQDYEPLEVIVVEDGGSDGTYEEALAIQDSRLTVHRNVKNLGQYANKNRCLELSRGRLIKYLDGDDTLHSNCVSTLVGAWEREEGKAGVVFARFEIVDAQGRRIEPSMQWGVSGRYAGLRVLDAIMRMRTPCSSFGNVTPHLFSREALEAGGGFPPDHSWSGDLEFYLKIFCLCDVCFIPEILSCYRVQPGAISQTQKVTRAIQDNLVMVERLKSYFEGAAAVPEYLKEPEYFQDWKVWASADLILSQYMRSLLGRSHELSELRDLFRQHGLERRLSHLIRRRFIPYVFHTLHSKARRFFLLPHRRALFRGGYRRILEKG